MSCYNLIGKESTFLGSSALIRTLAGKEEIGNDACTPVCMSAALRGTPGTFRVEHAPFGVLLPTFQTSTHPRAHVFYKIYTHVIFQFKIF